MSERILVTGAGGFVGGTIVEALFLGQQFEVYAGIARWLSAPRVARLAVPLVQCNILKPEEIATAFDGMDYIIHCAFGDEEATVEGTRNVIKAAADAGVKRVIHISTCSIYGDATGEVDEDTIAPPGTISPYGLWKVEAEAICKQANVDVVILRPGIIYGPFSSRWTMLYAQRLRSGWKHLGKLGTGKANLIHVHDVARFALAAIYRDGIIGESYNINGPEIVTWNNYLERFHDHLGLPTSEYVPEAARTAGATQVAVNASGVLRAVGKYAMNHHADKLRWLRSYSPTIRKLMEQTELQLRLSTNQDELSLFQLDATYLTNKVEKAFGQQSQIDIDSGLAMSVAWLHHMGEAA